MRQAGTQGAQDGQFAPALAQPGEHDRQQAGEAEAENQPGQAAQQLFAEGQALPELVENDAGKHGL